MSVEKEEEYLDEANTQPADATEDAVPEVGTAVEDEETEVVVKDTTFEQPEVEPKPVGAPKKEKEAEVQLPEEDESKQPEAGGLEVETESKDTKELIELEAPLSFFADESTASYAWVLWIAIYWTVTVWVPTLMQQNFANEGFIMWVFGFTATMACVPAIKAGLYPSGAQRDKPNAFDGKGRWTAMVVLLCLAIDFLAIAYTALRRGTSLDIHFRAVCHWLSMVWGSLFYFNRFYRRNRQIAVSAFPLEWLDIMCTCVVILFLHKSANDDDDDDNDNNSCLSKTVCVMYFVLLCAQLLGWLLPMVAMPNWGGAPNAKGVAVHLFTLDLCTNAPLVITVCVTAAFKYHPIVFADALYKTLGLVRSSSYYLVYYVWLRKGILGTIKDASSKMAETTDRSGYAPEQEKEIR